MIIKITQLKFIVINAILIVLSLLTNNLITGALFLIFNSLVLGHWLFIKNSWTCKFLFGLLFILVFASLVGTASFYLWFLNQTIFLIILFVIPLLLLFIPKKYPLIFDFSSVSFKFNLNKIILYLSYLIIFVSIFFILFKSQTTASIRSPWEVIPTEIFFLYFLATFILFTIIRFSKNSFPLLFIVLHSFLSFSVTWIIFKVGFDYDPFIHRTNVDLILTNGTLLPKPFYYIGQYSLIIFLYNLLNISIEYLDKLLVPLAAAIFIPTSIYYAFKDNFKMSSNILLLVIMSILIFPFTNFIVTTAQALANLFFLITILLSLYYVTHPHVAIWPLMLLTIMTLSIHPLSGIPLVFFFIILFIYQHWKNKFNLPKFLHQSILWEVVILGCIALPTAFIINSLTLSQLKVSLQTNWFYNILNSFDSSMVNLYYRKFVSLTDLVYNFGFNIIFIIILIFLIGFFFIYRHDQIKRYLVYLLGFFILIINYILLKSLVSFFSLISYEQLTYPRRILELSLYLLIPFLLITVYLFFKNLLKQKSLTIFLSFIILSLAISVSFYLSYPRVDRIVEDHGFSTSLTDIKTVNFIEGQQNEIPYIVLSSQPVSAAAIKELGFKYYYNNYFFYPVPTGSELYQLYEDLAYGKQKTDDIIATVKYLTGVNDIYFILNDYWFNAKDKIEQEKENANKWFAIDNKNFIFKYSN